MSMTLKLCSFFVLLLSLSSCAIDSSRVDESKKQTIKVDIEVQKEFDQALVLLKSSDFEQAIVVLTSVIAQEKRLAAPYVNLGLAYSKKGDEKKAEETFKTALKIEKENPVANNQLGLIYRKKGKFEDAKKAYLTALGKHAEYLPIIKNLGILCDIYMQDYQCALDQFQRYLELSPDDKTVGIWVADLKRRVK